MPRWRSGRFFVLGTYVMIVAASSPAWTGSWVYDDWFMVGNASMDGPGDLLAAFSRSSANYLQSNAATHAGAVTYRPLSMITLIAVQAFAPEAPLLHHWVSLSLHLASVVLLFTTLRAMGGVQLARLGALTFGLHPLGMEAYGWINGRSDVLAGLGIAFSSWALFARGRGTGLASGHSARIAKPGRAWLAGLGALIAGLAKETALVAALGLALASIVPSDAAQPSRRRDRFVGPLAVLAALALALAARVAVLGDVTRLANSVTLMHDVPLALMRLFGVALRSALVPGPRTMLNLSYELAQPLGWLELALLSASAGLLAWLAVRRRWRALLLLGTAGATIGPCVFVRHAFWLGCDRYLYLPLLLACLALGAPAIEARLATVRASSRVIASGTLLLVLSLSSILTAQSYHSQTDHILTMIHQRPEDPTGPLIGARWLWHAGDRDGARTLLDRVPHEGLPPPLASQLATRLGEMERTREALAVVDDMARRYPADPYVQLDVLAVELDQGQLREASLRARRLRPYPGLCQAARSLIEEHVRHPRWPPEKRREGSALLAGYNCQ